MKKLIFLLFLTLSIQFLNANPPQKTKHRTGEALTHQNLNITHQNINTTKNINTTQKTEFTHPTSKASTTPKRGISLRKEYLFKPDSIWGTDLLGMIISSDFYTYHNNHIGTPLFMTDLTGTKAWEAETDSFGNFEITLSGIENNIRLAGQYFDNETGLHYNWNRYYDPSTGRYISQDPIGFAGGISLYGYVGQNPIGGIDPTGLWVGIAFKALKFLAKSKYVKRALVGYGISRAFKPNAGLGERVGDVCITMLSMGFASYWSKIPSGWIANALGGALFSFLSTGNHLMHNDDKYKNRSGGLLELTIKMITDGSKGAVINILTMITIGIVFPEAAYSEVNNAAWGENTGFSDESIKLMSDEMRGVVKSKVFWDENIGGSSKSITNIVDDESLSPKNRKFLNNLKKLKSEVFF